MTYLSILPKIRHFLGLDASGRRSPLARSFTAFVRWLRRVLDLEASRRPSPPRRTFRPCLEGLEERLAPATFTVTKTGDDGTAGTFRWAIGQANANSGSTIDFNIGTQGTKQTITLDDTGGGTPLPALVNPTVINGYSQAGNTNNSLGVWVGINGNNITGDGLTVKSSGVTIEGLAIYGFVGNGIVLNNPSGAPGDIIQENYIGTDVTGTVVTQAGLKGNSQTGIVVQGPDDTIGGSTTNSMLFPVGAGNLISGNQADGIWLEGNNGAKRTVISFNFIGTDAAGKTITGYGNAKNGIEITAGSNSNTIGGTVGMLDPGNVIGGNGTTVEGLGGNGIVIDGSNQNYVMSNALGVGADGKTKLGNINDGILITNGATGNTIGGSPTTGLNVISGNGGNGVHLSGGSTTANVIEGNNIGVALDGTTAVGNGVNGVLLDTGAYQNTIGASGMSGPSNIISGNTQAGVATDASSSTLKNLIEDNYIGTDVTGTVKVPNATGVSIGGAQNIIGGSNMMGTGNLISGNTGDGVSLSGSQNQVLGNLIGTNAAGSAALANGGNGVTVAGNSNTIGDTAMDQGNVVSGNSSYGVSVSGQSNVIRNNLIGTDKTGKLAVANSIGVYVTGTQNTVGGLATGEGNVISGNTVGGTGVGLYLGGSLNIASGNSIGTDITGSAQLANSTGVQIGGSQNAISGATDALTYIAGNNRDGVYITGTNATVTGAWIGVGKNQVALGNGYAGVHINGGSGNTIGGGSVQNVISANGGSGANETVQSGISIEGTGATENVILGNLIGTNTSGVNGGATFANKGDGIYLSEAGANDTTIGGTAMGQGNVISGNGTNGIEIDSGNNLVVGNYIGIVAGGPTGAGAMDANGNDGVLITGSGNTIGGTVTGSLNVISGNTANGVEISGGNNNWIAGNYIGVGTDGTTAIGNEEDGVRVDGTATDNTIGGSVAAARNVISGNGAGTAGGFGVDFVGAGASGNTVDYDYIGLAIDGVTVVPNDSGWQGGNIAGNTWGPNNKHN